MTISPILGRHPRPSVWGLNPMASVRGERAIQRGQANGAQREAGRRKAPVSRPVVSTDDALYARAFGEPAAAADPVPSAVPASAEDALYSKIYGGAK